MFKQILAATDGSELGNKALATALTLAKAGGGNVTVLTVSDPVTNVLGTGGFGTFDAATLIEQLEQSYRTSAECILAAAREQATAAGLEITTLYLPDHLSAHGIVRTAIERGSDLIVMGSHGRRGLGRLLLGSQAAEVLSHSSVPVLVVK